MRSWRTGSPDKGQKYKVNVEGTGLDYIPTDHSWFKAANRI